jgi:saccharopine dehydrogenase-like NADP-dependent oxidoreductase
MWHKFNFTLNESPIEVRSHMAYIGKNSQYTAMSDTVGIPVGIAAKMLLNDKIKSRGVLLPIYEDIYLPILKELEKHGITFKEKEFQL